MVLEFYHFDIYNRGDCQTPQNYTKRRLSLTGENENKLLFLSDKLKNTSLKTEINFAFFNFEKCHIMCFLRYCTDCLLNIKNSFLLFTTKNVWKSNKSLEPVKVTWFQWFIWVTWVILGTCWTTFVFMCKLKSNCLLMWFQLFTSCDFSDSLHVIYVSWFQ